MSASDLLVLAPVDFLGLRCELLYLPGMNFFWFVSCVICGYMIYPFFQIVMIQIEPWKTIGISFVMYLIIIYMTYLQYRFGTNVSTYYIPMLRCLEMFIGAICARLWVYYIRDRKHKGKVYLSVLLFILETVAWMFFWRIFLRFGNKWMWYDIFILPLTGILMMTLSCFRIENTYVHRFIRSVSGVTYELYLLQTWIFAFFTSEWGVGSGEEFFVGLSNSAKILLVWGSTFALAVIVHEMIKIIVRCIRKQKNKWKIDLMRNI